MFYVGVDVAKDSHVLAVVDDSGDLLIDSLAFASSREGFLHAVSRLSDAGIGRADALVVVESTGHYHRAVCRYLASDGWRVAVVNPLRVDAFRNARSVRKTKTDGTDALLLADFARFDRPAPSELSVSNESLKRLTRYRAELVEQRTQLKNRVSALVDTLFPELPKLVFSLWSPTARALVCGFDGVSAIADAGVDSVFAVVSKASRGRYSFDKAQAIVDAAASSVGDDDSVLLMQLRSLYTLLQVYDSEIAAVADAIDSELAASDAAVMLSVSGVSAITVATFAGELGSADDFPNAKAVIAYAGIDPTVYQSGRYERSESHMSKRGSSHLRRILMLAANTARIHDSYFGDYYDSLRSRGKHHYVALSAVSRKLAGVMLAVWKEQRPYQTRPSVQSQMTVDG